MASLGGPLRDAVDGLASEAEEHLGESDRALLDPVRTYLAQPLAVAIVGRVSSGKSTLVNALLGVPIAATDATECTQVVTWYRHGRHPAASLVLADGTEQALLISSTGTLPRSLPLPLDQIRRIEVRDSTEALRRVLLVDTPGLASATGGQSDRTIALMAANSGAEAQQADAILFVFNGSLREDEAAAVDLFLRGEAAPDVAGTIGLLSKADVGSGADPLADSRTLAAELAGQHSRLFADVVAVSGLLAETVRCGRLTESHARSLAALADEWGEAEADVACADADLFCSLEASVDGGMRHDILERVGMHGARLCLESARQGQRRAHQLNAMLGRLSGFDRLSEALETGLTQRVDSLKARRAFSRLSDIAYGLHPDQTAEASPDDAYARLWLREHLQQLWDSPRFVPLHLLDAAHQVNTGRVALPVALEEQLAAMVAALPSLPRPGHAVDSLAQWRAFTLLASPGQRRVADAAIRCLELSITEAAR